MIIPDKNLAKDIAIFTLPPLVYALIYIALLFGLGEILRPLFRTIEEECLQEGRGFNLCGHVDLHIYWISAFVALPITFFIVKLFLREVKIIDGLKKALIGFFIPFIYGGIMIALYFFFLEFVNGYSSGRINNMIIEYTTMIYWPLVVISFAFWRKKFKQQ